MYYLENNGIIVFCERGLVYAHRNISVLPLNLDKHSDYIVLVDKIELLPESSNQSPKYRCFKIGCSFPLMSPST